MLQSLDLVRLRLQHQVFAFEFGLGIANHFLAFFKQLAVFLTLG
jgi:hypothetical protein